jgi:hypothetical protein
MLPMLSIPDMGTEQDMSQRQILARVDNDTQQNKILDARRLVYEKKLCRHLPTDSKAPQRRISYTHFGRCVSRTLMHPC